jgi:TatA/E family protein of Tat protein translocase
VLTLSPLKLLIVAVVAVILVGPDKLPHVGRQMGAGWRAFRQFHQRVEQEVRETIPDLPSSSEIARLARSPVAFLNRMADLPGTDVRAPGQAPDLLPDPAAGAAAETAEARRGVGAIGEPPADPSMN